MNETPKIALMFPGQGSQELNMADVWASHPIGEAVLMEASVTLRQDIITGCRDESLLRTTEFVQPALLACEIAAYRIIADEVDIDIEATAGHSLGQFASLVAAGILTLNEAVGVVKIRGEAMQRAGTEQPGTMMALLGRVDEASAVQLCEDASEGDDLVLANINAPGQLVISGSIAAIDRAAKLSVDRGIRGRQLQVAGAFHSELMRPAVKPISDALQGIEFREPLFPIVDNVTGELTTDPSVLRSNLERHVVSAVRWEDGVRALGRAGINMFVEVGPGKVLSGLINKIARSEESMTGIRCVAINSPELVRTIV